MIQFENVTKTYAGGKVKAVDGLDMKIEEGKVFGFIGPNGAGKTTTIKLLTGILSPDSGRTVFFSTHVLDVAERLCDEIGIIKRGRLIARGTLDELRCGEDSSLEEVFLELVEKKGE